MGETAIKLNPVDLSNPDTDIQYAIPDRIEKEFGIEVERDAYDYLEDEVNSLVMFFSTSSPKENAMKILDLFAQEQICENWVLESASIGLKDTDGYQVISPENYQGGFEVE